MGRKNTSPTSVSTLTWLAICGALPMLIIGQSADIVDHCPSVLPEPRFGFGAGGRDYGVVSPYDPNCAAEFAPRCNRTHAVSEAVCYNGTSYAAESCLYCNLPDFNPALVERGMCNPVVSGCPRDTQNTDARVQCLVGPVAHVCGSDRRTYKNSNCTLCNNVTVSVDGTCPQLPSLDTCACTDANAECTQAILGCSFDDPNVLCSYDFVNSEEGGFVRTNASALEAAGNNGPIFDFNLRNSGIGNFLFTNAVSASTAGQEMSPTFQSTRCYIEFAYFINGSGTQLSLGWHTALSEAPYQTQNGHALIRTIANETYPRVGGNSETVWHRHREAIPLTSNSDPHNLIPIFNASTNGVGGFVAIDAIEIYCFTAQNATEETGVCACRIGYRDVGTNGTVVCEAIQDQSGDDEPIVVVDRCPERTDCHAKQRCSNGPIDYQCSTGTVYRNRNCALCNYEVNSTIFPGLCPSAPNNDSVISNCVHLPANNLRSAELNASIQDCHHAPEERICWDNFDYRNIDCAICNQVPIPRNWPRGSCAHVTAVSPSDLIVEADCERWVRCADEHQVCECTGMVRYGALGIFTYQNSNGSIQCENSNFNDPTYGIVKACDCNVNNASRCNTPNCLRFPRRCPECAAVRTCLSGATDPVCLNKGQNDALNFRNLGCAECTMLPTNQSSFVENISPGWCTSQDPIDLVEEGRIVHHTCTNDSALEEDVSECLNGDAAPVCARGSNYFNRACARCSRFHSERESEISALPCSRINRPIIEVCDNISVSTGCVFNNFRPVCGTDGNSYKNLACALCNGLTQPQVSNGACYTDQQLYDRCEQVSCPANASCSLLEASCDFERGTCGWTNGTNGAEFQIGQGQTVTMGTGPTVDHTLGTPSGHYLFLEASEQNVGDRVEVVSPLLNSANFGFACRLQFWYHMYGANIGTLEVYLRYVEHGESSFSRRWVREPNADSAMPHYDTWSQGHIYLGGGAGRVQVKLVAIRGSGPTGDIAVDDFQLVCGEERGECMCDTGFDSSIDNGTLVCTISDSEIPPDVIPVPTAGPVENCPRGEYRVAGYDFVDFENGFGGLSEGEWMNEEAGGDDNFDWTYHAGHTPTNGTGPSVDHTFGNTSGHYIYIESSNQIDGHQAHLLSPILNLTEYGRSCRFSFWYHMYGPETQNITIDIRALNIDGESLSGNGSAWNDVWVVHPTINSAEPTFDVWRNHGQVQIDHRLYTETAQIRIRGFRGTGSGGDVALDDLEIICHSGNLDDGCDCIDGYARNQEGVCIADVLTTIRTNPDLTIALRFIEAADLSGMLQSQDGVTMFVAIDDALAHIFNLAAGNDTLDTYLSTERSDPVITSDYVVPRWLPNRSTTLSDGILYPTLAYRSITFNASSGYVSWPGDPSSAREVLYSIPASNGAVFVLGDPLPWQNAGELVCDTTPCDSSTSYCRTRARPGTDQYFANLTIQQCPGTCEIPPSWTDRNESDLVCAVLNYGFADKQYHTLLNSCMANCLNMTIAYLGTCRQSTCESLRVTYSGIFQQLQSYNGYFYSLNIDGIATMTIDRGSPVSLSTSVIFSETSPNNVSFPEGISLNAHLHNAPCSQNGGGHYQDPHNFSGIVDHLNENWPVVDCEDYTCAGNASNSWVPASWDVDQGLSIVVHDSSGLKWICADLLPQVVSTTSAPSSQSPTPTIQTSSPTGQILSSASPTQSPSLLSESSTSASLTMPPTQSPLSSQESTTSSTRTLSPSLSPSISTLSPTSSSPTVPPSTEMPTTSGPTQVPTTHQPTRPGVTYSPTSSPSLRPTSIPTSSPSLFPTRVPTTSIPTLTMITATPTSTAPRNSLRPTSMTQSFSPTMAPQAIISVGNIGQGSSSNIGLIAGGAAGGVVVLIAIGLLLYFFVLRGSKPNPQAARQEVSFSNPLYGSSPLDDVDPDAQPYSDMISDPIDDTSGYMDIGPSSMSYADNDDY